MCIRDRFRKYTPYYIMVVFLFVASTDYLSWMFNGIRQFMAVTIVFSATIFMLKKKYLPLLGVILLASSFHKTALLMIPCVLIAQGNASVSYTHLCCQRLFDRTCR